MDDDSRTEFLKLWPMGQFPVLKDDATLDSHKNLSTYLARIIARSSFARVLKEAEPYFHLFPYKHHQAG